MATGQCSKEINIQKEKLENFIQNREQWAVLIPGYLHHELINEVDMIWVFQGDFGIIQKAVKIKLKVKKSDAHQIQFDLEGLSDPIIGNGSFEIIQNQNESPQLIGNLTMKASGFLAGMMNPVLDNFIPRLIEQLVEAMAIQALQD